MTDPHDSLREAFSLLASAAAADAEPNPCLEERLMSELTNRNRKSGRRTALIAAVCLLAAIGGTVAVAAGGVEAIRNWFATAEVIHSDGTKTELEVTPQGTVWLDETHGVQAPPDSLERLKGRKVTIRLAPPDYVKPSGLTAEEERQQMRERAEAAQAHE